VQGLVADRGDVDVALPDVPVERCVPRGSPSPSLVSSHTRTRRHSWPPLTNVGYHAVGHLTTAYDRPLLRALSATVVTPIIRTRLDRNQHEPCNHAVRLRARVGNSIAFCDRLKRRPGRESAGSRTSSLEPSAGSRRDRRTAQRAEEDVILSGLVRSAPVKRDLPSALACNGAAARPRVVECGTAHAGAQHGQSVIAVRGARHPCVQPATAIGF